MATIPEQYERQRVGVQGYRVLNLDLDGVCADYKGAIRDYLQRQGIDVPERALQTAHYNLTREDGWPFETLDDYIETHKAAEREHLYATMKPLPGVAQALQRLANEHVYIRIVTHRLFVSGQHQMVVSDTAQWLDSNRIPYMSLCFTGLKDSMQATIHIDDSPANIETLREAGQHVVVFDQPYNSTYAGPRIDSWSDTNVETLLTLFESWPE